MSLNKKVAVAMSGGVDSSVAAIILKEQGYEVFGVTGIMQKDQDVSDKALAVCKSLGIKHYAIDLTEDFDKHVIKYFENSYAQGTTPNPCVACNKNIKWGKLFEIATQELGADLYATGHYATLIKEENKFKLKRAKDEKKDQLYMIFELTQEQLSKTLFPVGDLSKEEVRNLAQKHNIPSKDSKDSQDICFIPPPDSTKKYLLRTFKENKGDFIDIETDKKLGEHNGFYQYTIGQRKGIGIASTKALYVIKTDAQKNIVYIGGKENLFNKDLLIENVNWQQIEFSSKEEFIAMVKIRYNTTAKKAKVIPKDNSARIVFDEEVSAIAPGQAAVIYDKENTFLIGGGWIQN